MIFWALIQFFNACSWQYHGLFRWVKRQQSLGMQKDRFNRKIKILPYFTTCQNARRAINNLGLLNGGYLRANCLADHGNKPLKHCWVCWFLNLFAFHGVLLHCKLNICTCIIENNPTVSATHAKKRHKTKQKNDREFHRAGTRPVKIADELCQLLKTVCGISSFVLL